MHHFRRFAYRKKQSSFSDQKEDEEYHLKNGSQLLKELLALCNGNCRIPICHFSASEICKATEHSQHTIHLPGFSYMVRGTIGNRLVLIRFSKFSFNIPRDIAITAQMSHLKNVLRLVGCCLEFDDPIMVYEHVDAISLHDLLFKKADLGKSVSSGSRLRIANEIASTVVFLHSEFTTPIIHNDLKSSNVLIDQSSGVAKLLNFKWSISLPPGKLEVQGLTTSENNSDPEDHFNRIISQKTDVYSIGVILVELLTGEKVRTSLKEYRQVNAMDIVDHAIFEEHGTEIQQQLEDYYILLKKCVLEAREDRPYMIEVAKELRRIENCFCALTPHK